MAVLFHPGVRWPVEMFDASLPPWCPVPEYTETHHRARNTSPDSLISSALTLTSLPPLSGAVRVAVLMNTTQQPRPHTPPHRHIGR
mmetsp:Transcript_5299/g.12504  ORF Transcript_5299/g.12504 Transcript_5299/m.12504 type:complete len:86 (-) Transcript_5299:359-616(-)